MNRFLKWLSRWFVTRSAYDRLMEVGVGVATAPLYSGVCCCGESMEQHDDPYNCGHSPVDSGWYHLDGTVQTLAQLKENPYHV